MKPPGGICGAVERERRLSFDKGASIGIRPTCLFDGAPGGLPGANRLSP